jgi:hypothetical protein
MITTAHKNKSKLGSIIIIGMCLFSPFVQSGMEPPAMSPRPPLPEPDYRLTSAKCTPVGSDFLNIGRVARVKINGVWLNRCVSQRFIDQGETVMDRTTGLQWEKKTDDGGVHDKDNLYTWTANTDRQKGPWNFDGTVSTAFIERLNTSGACYAGYCDWRLPTIDELKGIIDTRRAGCPAELGCIDPALGLTPSVPTESYYWTATSVSEKSWFAFDSGGYGGVGYNWKDIQHYARAVRKGN